MKREKIFKAKSIKNKNFWIYWNQLGYVISDIDSDKRTWTDIYLSHYNIITESVCEYTGITDKNNIKIFEDDLLSDGKTIFKVEWNQQQTCWWIKPIKSIIETNITDDFILLVLENENLGNGYYSRKDLEVIGNIIDNSNLIE